MANDTDCSWWADAVMRQPSRRPYQYASFDVRNGALGSFTEATGTDLDARRELAAFVSGDASSALFIPYSCCEAYAYASSCFTGSRSFVTTIQEPAVQSGGARRSCTTSLAIGGAPQTYAGHAALFSEDGAYVMAGAGSAGNPPTATDVANQAAMTSTPNSPTSPYEVTSAASAKEATERAADSSQE